MDKKLIAKKKKEMAWKPVTIPEMVEMKAYKLLGHTNEDIALKVGRTGHTVGKYLKLFERELPTAGDLKESVLERLNELKEQMLANSESIVMAADAQVMTKIFDEETTAMDAARIADLHTKRIFNISGTPMSDPGGESDSPRVINFIKNIINITQKDDRLEPKPAVEGTVV
jgi:predicted transcriptional regulator